VPLNDGLVANLFESMGPFVRTGMMEERIACEPTAHRRGARKAWRSAPGKFRIHAPLAQRFIATVENDGYPPGVERTPLSDAQNG
jgi:hypothetical protein